MFDMGFIADLRFILRRLPPHEQRQSLPVLRHALLPGARADLGVHEQPGADHDHAAAEDGRARRADRCIHVGRDEKFRLLLGLLRREGGDAHPDLLEHARGSAPARGPPDRATAGRRARSPATSTRSGGCKILNDFKEGQPARPGRHRRRLARAAHRGGDPRRQLGPAPGRRGLRAPHRPHGARRRRRQGDRASSTRRAPWRSRRSRSSSAQKIPVEWADDDLFMQEIKPTAEERRRYSDERRARLAARDRFGGRGGDRRDRGRPHGRPHGDPGRPASAPPPPPPAAEGAPGQRRGRPRRRGRGGGPRPEGSPPPTALAVIRRDGH